MKQRGNIFWKRTLTCVLALMLALTGCGSPGGDLMAGVRGREKESQVDLNGPGAQAAADFSIKLLNAALEKNPGQNALFSPLSALCALAMTANGAAGDTRAQFEALLGLPVEELCQYLSAYCAALPSGEKYQFHGANSLWLREGGVQVKREFLEANAGLFGAAVFEKPFDSGTLEEINGWVEEQTKGMIPTILQEIKPEEVLYLINALAFEAEWADIYEDAQVRERLFTQEDGAEVPVDMMESTENLYLEDEKATGFLKYYAGEQYAFGALLPKEGVTLGDYLKELDGQGLRQVLQGAQEREIIAGIPKFQQECGYQLGEALRGMGLNDAFDPAAADFSALGQGAGEEPLYIGQVVHKTFLSVYEKGTQAGAATAVGIEAGSIQAEEPPRVVLNRPFLYMLVDAKTMTPVFIGTAYAPAQS